MSGQTAAMMAGFDHARGRVVVSLDGDLQNDPRDIPALLAKLDEGYDLVCGWRQRGRTSSCCGRCPSWVANRIIRRLTGVQITDNGCSLKAYRRDLLDRISLYAEQHRFIPGSERQRGRADHRDAGAAPRPALRREQVRHLPHGEGPGGSADAENDHHLPVAAAARIRHAGDADGDSRRCCSRSMALVAAARNSSASKAEALVFPGAALVCAGAAFYLLMLGLVAEVALNAERESANEIPTAWEVR